MRRHFYHLNIIVSLLVLTLATTSQMETVSNVMDHVDTAMIMRSKLIVCLNSKLLFLLGYLCNGTAYWTKNAKYGNTTYSPLNGNTIECKCSAGTFTSDKRDMCIPCDSKCLTCSSLGSDSCDQCKTGAYKMFSSTCTSSCPSALYTKDDANHLCEVKETCIY